ncbi:MAG: hypothetical protein ACRDX8_02160 [Acidimicrobiales bacterium]
MPELLMPPIPLVVVVVVVGAMVVVAPATLGVVVVGAVEPQAARLSPASAPSAEPINADGQ